MHIGLPTNFNDDQLDQALEALSATTHQPPCGVCNRPPEDPKSSPEEIKKQGEKAAAATKEAAETEVKKIKEAAKEEEAKGKADKKAKEAK